MRRHAILALLAGVFLAGFSPMMVRLSPVGPGSTACWRLLAASLLAFAFARGAVMLPRRVLLAVLLAGFLLAADIVLWSISIVSTTVMEASLLVMLYPLPVAAVEVLFLKQRLGWPLLSGGLVAFAGVVVMVVGAGTDSAASGRSSLAGDLLAVAAAAFYAASLLIVARSCRGHGIRAITFWQLFSAGICALPMLWLEARGVPAGGGGWAFLATYALVTFTGYILTNVGLVHVSASIAAILGYGQPVIATVIAYFLMSEVPGHVAFLGGAVVLGGLVLASGAATRKPAFDRAGRAS
jgi:drug/metabolite transporter (DMT)-like permease